MNRRSWRLLHYIALNRYLLGITSARKSLSFAAGQFVLRRKKINLTYYDETDLVPICDEAMLE
jgi:hypothetical protein